MIGRVFLCTGRGLGFLGVMAIAVRLAWAHGDPLLVTKVGNAITTNDPNPLDAEIVFQAELEPVSNLLFTDIPGFAFHNFSWGDVVSFEVVDHLWYWNANGGVTVPHRNEQMVIERQTAPFPNVTVSHNPQHRDGQNVFVPGFAIDTISAQSTLHRHLLAYFFENVPQPPHPNDDGAYGVTMRLTSPGYETSAPLLIVFNQGLDAAAFSTAVTEIQDRAFYRLFLWSGGAGNWGHPHWTLGGGPPTSEDGAEINLPGAEVTVIGAAAADMTTVVDGELSIDATGVLSSPVSIVANGVMSGEGQIVGNVINGGVLRIGARAVPLARSIPEPSAGCLAWFGLTILGVSRTTCRAATNRP